MAIVEEDAVATEAEDVDNYCFFHYFVSMLLFTADIDKGTR